MKEQPMAAMGPSATLVHSPGGERWKIVLRGFDAIREQLGADTLRGFSRCFVHADRLTSLASFPYTSEQFYGRDTVGFGRDLQVTFWFTVGTLRELAIAIRDLRSALAKRGVLEPSAPCWVQLRAVERRWEDDAFFREMRNQIAFHLDPDIIDKGLSALAAESEVTLCKGELRNGDAPRNQSMFDLGWEACLRGLDKNPPDIQRFIKLVGTDHGVGSAVQDAFVLALKRVGIPVKDKTAADTSGG